MRARAGVLAASLAALTLAAGATAMPADSGGTGDTVIGFDDVAAGTSITTQYGGVSFGQGPAGHVSVPPRAQPTTAAHSAPNAALIGFTPEAGTPRSDAWMAFDSPEEHVSLYAGDPAATASHTIELDALDDAGHLIASDVETLGAGEAVDRPLSVHAGGAAIAYAEVFDKPAADGTRTASVVIDDLSFGAGGAGLVLQATEGAPFSGVVGHTQGSDPGAVTIDWGDGSTSPGTTAPSGTGYDISGSHTYAAAGHDTILVHAGAATPATASMSVADAPLHATWQTIDTATGTSGHVDGYRTLARFTDENPSAQATDFHATVDWGDGSPTGTAQVNAVRGGFIVTGAAHDYPANPDPTEKRWRATVTIDDVGGAEAVAYPTITVPATPPATTPSASCPSQPGAAGATAQLGAPQAAPDGSPRQTLTFGTLVGGGAWGGQKTFTLVAHGCWAFAGYTHDASQDAWSTQGDDVELNGFTLHPLDRASTLVTDTAGDVWGQGRNGTAVFEVEVPGEHGGLRTLGRVDLARTPWAFDDGLLGHFGPAPGGPRFGSGTVLGGDIRIPQHTDATAVIDAAMQLPNTFGSTPEGGAAPTGDLHFVLGGPGASSAASSPPGGGECTDNCVTPAPGTPTHCCHNTRGTLDGSVDANGHMHLEIADFYLGALDVQHAFLDYDPDNMPAKGGLWTGGGQLQFGPVNVNAEPPPDDNGFGFYGDGEFDYAGAEAAFDPPAQIGPVSLYGLGAHVRTHPTVFHGHVVVGLADVLKVDGGVLLVFASDHEPYTYRPGDLQNVDALQRDTVKKPVTGFGVGVSGQGSIDLGALGEVPIAHVYGFYTPGYVEFGGGLNLDLKAVSVAADVKGAFDTDRGLFDVDASVRACAGVFSFIVDDGCLLAMKGHLSSYGMGACVDALGLSVGFRDKWGGPSSGADGVNLFLLGCDDGMGPITVDLNADHPRAAEAAQAGEPVHLDLPPGTPLTNITVKGAGGAPAVEVTGPHGAHATLGTPEVAPKAGRPVVMAADPADTQTLIGLRRPASGRWTITPLPGSPAITSVSHADGLAPAKVAAVVASRHGGGKVLRYHVRRRPGQTVSFVERAAGVFHVIGTAHGARGTLRFTPATGTAGRRTILAQISLAGTPAGDLVAGHYVAPPDHGLTAARDLRLSRTPAGVLNAAWTPIPRAAHVLVDVRLSSGAHVTSTLHGSATRVAMTKVLPGSGAHVTVTGIDAGNRLGRPAHATLRAAGPPARVAGLEAKRRGQSAQVRWKPVPGAIRYTLSVSVHGESRPRELLTRLAHATLTGLGAGPVRVSVRAVGAAGRRGAAGSVRLR